MDNTIFNQIYSTAVNAASFAAEEISQIDAETALRITAIALPIFAGLAVLAGAIALLYQYKFRQADSQNKKDKNLLRSNPYSSIYANTYKKDSDRTDSEKYSTASCPLISQVQRAYRPSDENPTPNSVSPSKTADKKTPRQHADFVSMIRHNYGVKAQSEISVPPAKKTIAISFDSKKSFNSDLLANLTSESDLASTLRSL